MQDTNTTTRSSCWLPHTIAHGALSETVLGPERNSSPPSSDLFQFMLILIHIYFVVILISLSNSWGPFKVVTGEKQCFPPRLLPCRGVSGSWPPVSCSCGFARCTVSVDQSTSKGQTSHFPHPLAGGKTRVCQHHKILPLLLGGAKTGLYSGRKTTSKAIFPQEPCRGLAHLVHIDPTGIAKGSKCRKAASWLFSVDKTTGISWSWLLLIAARIPWICLWQKVVAGAVVHPTASLGRGPARIWGPLHYKFTSYFVPGGKMPDVFKRWLALLTLGSMWRKKLCLRLEIRDEQSENSNFPNDLSSSREINGKHWDVSITQIST